MPKKTEHREQERRKNFILGKFGFRCTYLDIGHYDMVADKGYCLRKKIFIRVASDCSPDKCEFFYWQHEKRDGSERRERPSARR